MIRPLYALLDADGRRLLRAQVACIAAYAVAQGIAFVLLVPILGALLEEEPAGGWLAGLAGVVLLAGVAFMAQAMLAHRPGTAVARTIHRRLGDHRAALPLGWFGPERVGELGRLTSQGVTDVMGAAAHLLRPMVAAMVTPLTVVAAMYLVDWRLALATTLTIPLIYGTHRLAGALARHAAGAVQSAAAEAGGRIVEFARVQPILRAYGRAGERHRLLDDGLLAQHAARRRQLGTMSGGLLASSLAVQLAFLVVTVYGVDRALGGSIDVPELVAVLVLLARFGQPLVEAADIVGALRVVRASLRGVQRVLAAAPLPESAAPRTPDGAAVQLTGVRFSYGDHTVLDGIDLDVPAGACSRSSVPRVRARRRSPGSWRASGTTTRAACGSAASTCVRWRARRSWRRSRSCFRTSTCSTTRSRPTCAPAGRTRATPRSAPPPAVRASTRSSTGCPTAGRPGGGGRHGVVGRRAPARLDRPRAPEGRADRRARRGDRGTGSAQRGARRGGARRAEGRPDDDHHRPPPVDRPRRGRDRRARARPDRRARPDAELLVQGGRYADFWRERTRTRGWRLSSVTASSLEKLPSRIPRDRAQWHSAIDADEEGGMGQRKIRGSRTWRYCNTTWLMTALPGDRWLKLASTPVRPTKPPASSMICRSAHVCP